MKNYEIREILSRSYINSLLEDEKFDLIAIAKKNKINLRKINILFPNNTERNKYELLKIFNNLIDDKILMQFYDEIENEEISFYEKVLEALFIKFETLNSYKKALENLSSNLNKKLKNLIILNDNNHQFMVKILKISGDNDNNLKLNIKAFILNLIYLKNLNLFLSSKDISLEKVMNVLDKDLKNLFKSNFLFKIN